MLSLFDASLAKITGLADKITQVEQAVQERLHYEETRPGFRR